MSLRGAFQIVWPENNALKIFHQSFFSTRFKKMNNSEIKLRDCRDQRSARQFREQIRAKIVTFWSAGRPMEGPGRKSDSVMKKTLFGFGTCRLDAVFPWFCWAFFSLGAIVSAHRLCRRNKLSLLKTVQENSRAT